MSVEQFAAEIKAKTTLRWYTDVARQEIRHILMKDEYSGLKYTQIAEVLHIDRGSVKKLKELQVIIPEEKTPVRKISDDELAQLEVRLKDLRREFKQITLQTGQNLIYDITDGNISYCKETVRQIFKQIGLRCVTAVKKQLSTIEHQSDDQLFEDFWNQLTIEVLKRKLQPRGVHIMDETGIHDDSIVAKTYAFPEEKAGYIQCADQSTKDTFVVTLSINGNGHGYYLSYKPDVYQHVNGVNTLKEKGIKGMGTKQMMDWAKSFVNYAEPGDLLIMDNLSSHLNDEVTKFLSAHNITVLYLPVRCAAILSPLDNSFFSCLKRRLAAETALKPYENADEKRERVFAVFRKMIDEGIGLNYMKHCGYNKIFPSAFQGPMPKPIVVTDVYMATGRRVRAEPDGHFARVLTFDETRHLLSIDYEEAISISFNKIEPRTKGRFLVCYGLDEEQGHSPNDESQARTASPQNQGQLHPNDLDQNGAESIQPDPNHQNPNQEQIQPPLEIVPTNWMALIDNKKRHSYANVILQILYRLTAFRCSIIDLMGQNPPTTSISKCMSGLIPILQSMNIRPITYPSVFLDLLDVGTDAAGNPFDFLTYLHNKLFRHLDWNPFLIKDKNDGHLGVYAEVHTALTNNIMDYIKNNIEKYEKKIEDVFLLKVNRFILDLENSTRKDVFKYYQVITINGEKYELNAVILQKSTRGANTTHFSLLFKDRFRWIKIDDTIKQLNARVYDFDVASMGHQSVIGLMYIKASIVNDIREPLQQPSSVPSGIA